MAYIYDLTDTWNAGGTTFYGIKMNVTNTASAPGSKLLSLQVGGSEKFGVDKDGAGYFSGNVGIGTSSPAQKLEVNGAMRVGGASGVGYINFSSTVAYDTSAIGCAVTTGFGDSLGLAVQNATGVMTFATNSTERMRIDSSGNLLVGTTSNPSLARVRASNAGNDIFYAVQAAAGGYCYKSDAISNGGTYYHMEFLEAGAARGTITSNGSTVSYNTTSDYRLKDIVGPIQNSGAYIDALKPVQGRWKADGSRFIGLLAHEVQEVSETQIATGEKDGEEMQAMDYSAPEIIANLIAEIQSLRARVARLEGN